MYLVRLDELYAAAGCHVASKTIPQKVDMFADWFHKQMTARLPYAPHAPQSGIEVAVKHTNYQVQRSITPYSKLEMPQSCSGQS